MIGNCWRLNYDMGTFKLYIIENNQIKLKSYQI